MNFKLVASLISARLNLIWLARLQCALRERMDSSAKLPPAHMRYVACHLSSQYNIKKTKVSSYIKNLIFYKKFDIIYIEAER